ncbi:MAG: hypothetical protein JMM75_01860 [Candidatus Xiphinematobacter sp.]|nr:MAG: hypothetical protein JMM75_01860 [Candidatus Xiphinematobacter sp.]
MKVNLSPLPAHKTLAIIMGGGAGTRLFPLTKERAKPAVPLGGKYRLVDIPISNCLNSSIRSIYVLTQFNSTSLHRHINASYKFDSFTPSFVEILAAQQTPKSSRWYQGTADAVRQNLRYFLEQPYEYFIVLSGDQLYRMDYRAILRQHMETDAEITIATTPVSRASASGFGIMQTDEKCHIAHFVEKPKDPTILDTLKIPPDLLKAIGHSGSAELYQASMGIYVFNRSILSKCLDNDLEDFGALGTKWVEKAPAPCSMVISRHVLSALLIWSDFEHFKMKLVDLPDLSPSHLCRMPLPWHTSSVFPLPKS